MKMAGAIFDMDGTLLDSMIIWTCIGERYLASKGLRPDENKENINYIFLNNPLSYSVEYVKKNYGIEGTQEDILAEVKALLRKFYMEEMIIKDHVIEFLEELKKNGVKLCVATATEEPLAKIALKRVGIYDYFEMVYSCQTVKKSKDVPDIYEIALAHLGTKKAETFVFEDALYAAITAKNAGFPVVGIYDVSEVKQDELKQLVDSYQVTYEQLLSQYREGQLNS